MALIIVFIALLFFLLCIFTFRGLVYLLSGGMFAILLVWLPDVIMKYVFYDIFGVPPSRLLYLFTIGSIILVVFLCVEKNLKGNWFLNISLGLGLITGLFLDAMYLFFAR